VSKTDPIEPRTRLVFEPAAANEVETRLATAVSGNLNTMASDLNVYAQPYKITYDAKDLIVYLSMDDLRRTVSIWSVSRKSNTNTTAAVGFETPYYLDSDSIVFEKPLQGTYVGLNVSLRSIKLNQFLNSSITVCTDPTSTHIYRGVTSTGESVTLEPTYSDPAGGLFTTEAPFFDAPLGNILLDGEQAYQQLQNDLSGVSDFQIYYNFQGITAMGFRLVNEGAETTFALWSFTMTRMGNKLTFNFAPDLTLYGNANPDADLDKVKEYILALAGGGNTYAFKLNDMVYEFHNPCTGWSYIAIGQNN
jgi:hypothetical protein